MRRLAAMLLSACVALPAGVVARAAEGNLALGRPCTLSRPALYGLTHDAGDAAQLTDGRLAPDTIWMSKAAVGWLSNELAIGIEVDLGAPRATGAICMRAGRNIEAGVSFPRRVDIFVSDDGAGYAWAGRMTPAVEEGEGAYLAKSFCTPDHGHRARFVHLSVVPQGQYFFTDEITIAPSAVSARHLAARSDVRRAIPKAKLAGFALEIEALERLAKDLDTRVQVGFPAILKGEAANGPSTLVKEAAMAMEGIGRLRVDLADGSMLRSEAFPIGELYRSAGLFHSRWAREEIELASASPWPRATPLDGATPSEPSKPLDIVAGHHGALAVAVTHGGPGQRVSRLSAQLAGPASAGLSVRLRLAEPVIRADGVMTNDALVPLADGELDLTPGETRQIWIDLAARPGAPTGPATVRLALSGRAAGVPQKVRTLDLPVMVHPPIAAMPAPSTVVWGYLDGHVVKDRPGAAVADMLAHGVNTAVLPAYHLPWPKPGARPGDKQIGDYAQFDQVMAHLKGHGQYLFFMSLGEDSALRTFGGRHAFLSPEWSALFAAWLKEWTARLQAAGIGTDAFALYPVDEPHPGGQADALVAVSRLVRRIDPEIRIYTTLHEPKSLTDALIDSVDIVQLNGRAESPEIIGRLKARGKRVWAYATDGGGKAGDPATFYRVLGWNAFISGLDGFGFWAYADTGHTGSAWSDIDDVRPDFAVVYEPRSAAHGHAPIPSKRWEAFREGVQDHAILEAAFKAARGDAQRAEVMALAREGRARIGDPAAFAPIRRKLIEKAAARAETPKAARGKS